MWKWYSYCMLVISVQFKFSNNKQLSCGSCGNSSTATFTNFSNILYFPQLAATFNISWKFPQNFRVFPSELEGTFWNRDLEHFQTMLICRITRQVLPELDQSVFIRYLQLTICILAGTNIRTRIEGGQWRLKITIYEYWLSVYIHI